MGTRNLTVVKSNNKIKVAQYGQWDGYPGGQGQTIIDFLLNEEVDLEHFKKLVDNLEFFTQGEIEELDEKLGADVFKKYEYLSRDVAADILNCIYFGEYTENSSLTGDKTYKFDKIEKLQNQFSFGYDSLFCEWAHVLDLDNNVLVVYQGFQKDPPENGLWKNPTEDDMPENRNKKYFSLKPIAKMDINKDTLKDSWNRFLDNLNKQNEDE